MLVEFKDQPELGIWHAYNHLTDPTLQQIKPHKNVPDGLVTLSEYATISVRRSALRRHRPQQEERLF